MNNLIRESSNLSIGIVGLPNIGKSTLFNLLTDSDSPVENYPFCTIDPHISLIIPNDIKLNKLTEIYKPKEKTNIGIKLHDIAGLVKGASEGEGLGNAFLENIRQVDGIIHVIKSFTDVNLSNDLEIINNELRIKDIQIVNSNKKSIPNALFNKLINILNKGLLINYDSSFDPNDIKLIIQLNLLTAKKQVHLINVSEELYELIYKDGIGQKFDKIMSNNTNLALNKEIEQIKALMHLNPFFYCKSKINKEELVVRLKECLNIITYYTCGKKEVRGWNISKGTTANNAGRVIHSDFVSNFIAVEVIKYEDVIKHQMDCKKLGKVMTKGKTYVIEESDILEFKIGTKGKKINKK